VTRITPRSPIPGYDRNNKVVITTCKLNLETLYGTNWQETKVVVLEKLVCDPIERDTNTSQYGADLNSLITNGNNFLTKQEKETK
jgi:hypothetical protein